MTHPDDACPIMDSSDLYRATTPAPLTAEEELASLQDEYDELKRCHDVAVEAQAETQEAWIQHDKEWRDLFAKKHAIAASESARDGMQLAFLRGDLRRQEALVKQLRKERDDLRANLEQLDKSCMRWKERALSRKSLRERFGNVLLMPLGPVAFAVWLMAALIALAYVCVHIISA